MPRSRIVVASMALGLAFVLAGCGGGGGGGGSSQELSFTAVAFSVNENGTPIAAVTVQRTGGSSGAVSATITLTDGTATGGAPPLAPPVDYDNSPIVVSFADGDTADKVVTVPVFDDDTVEGNETVTLTLGNPTGGAAIGAPAAAVLTIVDDDSHGTLQLSAPAYGYNEGGIPVAAIAVQRIGGIDGAVSALITSSDGTANSDPNSMVEPVDYTPLNTVISFADQDGADKVVVIAIVQDLLPEMDETFTVSLSQPTGGALIGLPATATVTILDDDTTLLLPAPLPSMSQEGTFGTAVAAVHALIAIGAPGSIPPVSDGVVRLFDPAFATLVRTLTETSFQSDGIEFGTALAAAGPRLAVGAIGVDSGSGVEAGSIFVFDATNGAFMGSAMCPSSDSLNNSDVHFGNSIVHHDEIFYVGAPRGQNGFGNLGKVYLIDALAGTFLGSVTSTAGGAMIGQTQSKNGDGLFVGATEGGGLVAKFDFATLTQTLTMSNPFVPIPPQQPSGAFGTGLAALGNLVAIGAPDDDTHGPDAGIVYLMDANSGQIVQTITPPGPLANGRFGASIAVVRDRFVIQQKNAGTSACGQVHVYDGAGAFVQTLDDPTPTANANFGAAMTEFDGQLVIGAPNQMVGGFQNVGAAFVMKVN